MITIRKAKIQDIDTILNLNNELCKFEVSEGFDSYKPDWSLSNESKEYFLDLIKNQYVAVAEDNGYVVGYLAGSIYEDGTYSYYEGKTSELNNMFVANTHRKSGIGSLLINSFEKWCKDKNVSRMLVTASYLNSTAQKFYCKNGFSNINITLKKDLK